MLSYRPSRPTASVSLILGCGEGLSPPGGRDEVRESDGFRPVPPHGRARDETNGVRARASHGRGENRAALGRDREQPMRPQERPPPVRGTREPLSQGGPDPVELGGTTRHRDDRDAKGPVEGIQVEDVEPPDHRAVHEHRADAVERPQAENEGCDPPRSVGPIDADTSQPDRLHVLGEGHRDGGDRRVPVASVEGTVVDSDDPRMRFRECPPQR